MKKGSKQTAEHIRKRSGENSSTWKGGRHIDKYGYVRISCKRMYKKDHREREHRLIMETELGRRLLTSEIIHHIDGDKTNNELANLFLSDNSAHQKAHRTMELIVYKLLKDKKVIFKNGKYLLC